MNIFLCVTKSSAHDILLANIASKYNPNAKCTLVWKIDREIKFHIFTLEKT